MGLTTQEAAAILGIRDKLHIRGSAGQGDSEGRDAWPGLGYRPLILSRTYKDAPRNKGWPPKENKVERCRLLPGLLDLATHYNRLRAIYQTSSL